MKPVLSLLHYFLWELASIYLYVLLLYSILKSVHFTDMQVYNGSILTSYTKYISQTCKTMCVCVCVCVVSSVASKSSDIKSSDIHSSIIAGFFLLQYKISNEDLGKNAIWLSVWNWNDSGRHSFLGEVHCLPLSDMDLTNSKNMKVKLEDTVSTERYIATFTVMVATIFSSFSYT